MRLVEWVRRRWSPEHGGRLRYADPLEAGRHPFQIYLLTLCLVSGFPLIIGRHPTGAVDKYLPPAVYFAWGAFLFGGAALALVGSHWRRGYDVALTLERAGLICAGAGAISYALVRFAIVGLATAIGTTIVLGFGLSCIRRARDIGNIIRRAIKEPCDRAAVDTEPDR